MKKLSYIVIILSLLIITGCAGLGANKKTTLVPDEIWVSTDLNPQETGRLTEVTVGVKWKLN